MVTTNAEYYLRLLLLNVQVATPALCETFFSFVGKTTNKRVDDFLKVFENGFKALEKKRIIKKADFTKLFPSSGKTLVREWDISLLCSVLSHCCTLNGKLYELRDMLYQEARRNVNNFVQTHRTAINLMKGAEIDDDEYEIVYPADYSDTEYEKWSTHLIMQILIKICPAKKTSVMIILRNILIQELDLRCSSRDINTFLNLYKGKFLDLKNKCKLSKAQFDKLFPINGADIYAWDDHTLEVVLLNTTSTLSKKSISSMKKIRTIRSDFLAHRGDAEIKFPEFSKKQLELTKAVTKILKEEKLPILEIKEKINDIVDGPLEIRPTIDCLKAYYVKESSQSDMILGALNSIESNVLGVVESVSRKVEVGFGKMDSKFEELLKEFKDFKEKIPESAYTETAEVRCVDMIFAIKSITVEKKKKAEDIMMNSLKQAEQNTTAQIRAAFEAIREIMMEDGKIIIEVKRGSVILVMKCFSVKALHRLLEYAGSELLQSHLKEAVNALDILIGGISEITVSMSYDSLVNVCEDIVRYLIYYVDHTSHLKVTIKRQSIEDLKNIVREFQVGEGASQLRILSSKLSNYLGENITIDTVVPLVCSSSEIQLKDESTLSMNNLSPAKLDYKSEESEQSGRADQNLGRDFGDLVFDDDNTTVKGKEMCFMFSQKLLKSTGGLHRVGGRGGGLKRSRDRDCGSQRGRGEDIDRGPPGRDFHPYPARPSPYARNPDDYDYAYYDRHYPERLPPCAPEDRRPLPPYDREERYHPPRDPYHRYPAARYPPSERYSPYERLPSRPAAPADPYDRPSPDYVRAYEGYDDPNRCPAPLEEREAALPFQPGVRARKAANGYYDHRRRDPAGGDSYSSSSYYDRLYSKHPADGAPARPPWGAPAPPSWGALGGACPSPTGRGGYPPAANKEQQSSQVRRNPFFLGEKLELDEYENSQTIFFK